jgi:hypothetical protein
MALIRQLRRLAALAKENSTKRNWRCKAAAAASND